MTLMLNDLMVETTAQNFFFKLDHLSFFGLGPLDGEIKMWICRAVSSHAPGRSHVSSKPGCVDVDSTQREK
jgi:hypothetical protein